MILLLQIKQVLKSYYYRMRKIVILIFFWPFTLLKKTQVPSDPASVLVISQRRMGDAVLSLPLIHALREKFPGCVIAVLTHPNLREIFEISSEVDRVIEYTQNRKKMGFLEIFRLIMGIRKQKYPLIIDLNTDGCFDFALVSGFSGGEYSIGYDRGGRGIFFDAVLPAPSEEQHTVDRFLALLLPLRIENPAREVRLNLPGNDLELFQSDDRSGEGAAKVPLVGIHPGGTHWTQRWPVEYFAELADELILNGSARVILCGGPSDWEAIRQVQERMRKRPDVAPPFPSLRDFAAFLSYLDLLICNNSGPLHLACAVETPTLSFMGPTVATQWWPVGERHTVFRKEDLPCIGCNRGYCRMKTHDCMRGILPEKVLEAVRSQLDGSKYILETSRN